MNRDNRRDLRDLADGPAWKFLFYDLSVSCILLFTQALDYWLYLNINFPWLNRPFARRTGRRAHYVGADVERPHKLASALLLGVLIGGVVQAPTVELAMMWVVVWGTVFSAIVIYKSVKRWLVIMEYIGPNRKKAI